jgi:uncharacterized protein (DUF2267 family)
MDYHHASEQFEKFMLYARDEAGLATTHMAYNMVCGVLFAFRCRMTIADALRFADFLPPGVRALFVSDWVPRDTPKPFGSNAEILADVKSVRAAHNFAPPDAVAAVARALRRLVDQDDLDQLLTSFPDQARDYWRG